MQGSLVNKDDKDLSTGDYKSIFPQSQITQKIGERKLILELYSVNCLETLKPLLFPFLTHVIIHYDISLS